MRRGADREGDRERPGILLVEEHPDHAAVLAELLEERGWRVEIGSTAPGPGVPASPVVLLSTATDPAGAADLLASLGRRSPRPLVLVLDGPGRRWDPAATARSAIVAGILEKTAEGRFLDRLADLAEAWSAPRAEAGAGVAAPRPAAGLASPEARCREALLRWRTARLRRLLVHLAPLARLGGAGAAPLAELLSRAERLAAEVAVLAGGGGPPRENPFRPADLLRLRRKAWEVLLGLPVRVAGAGAAGVAIGSPPWTGRLLDFLAAALSRSAEALEVLVLFPDGTDGLRLRLAGGGAMAEATVPGECGELARELGLEIDEVTAGTVEVRFRRPAPGWPDAGTGDREVLVASEDGDAGRSAAAFFRERGARVTRVVSREELEALLVAGARFRLVLLGLPGSGLAHEVRRALPRAVLAGFGETSREALEATLAADGLGWIETPPRPEDLLAAWRLGVSVT